MTALVKPGNASDIPPELFETTDTVTVLILAFVLVVIRFPSLVVVCVVSRPKIAEVGAALVPHPIPDIVLTFPTTELA